MRAFVAVAAIAFACQKTAPPPAEAGATTTTTTCAATVASYDTIVAAGGVCTTSADCVCFNGGVSQKTPCGGATDKVSAAKLDKLIKDYESAHCDALMCAAMICTPTCNAGHCTGDAPAVITPPVVVVDASAPSTSWTACASDLDCTYVSLGCCDTTPVNRAHADEAKRKLERSGHPYCPPKTACGPSADGTWAGAPGKCAAGNCVLRSM
jgi:hypothetical protein